MKFSVQKLQKDQAASSMRRVPVRLFKPYTLMISPVYTLLERNAKFVAVKAPLSFFSPQELEKFRSVTEFFLPEFIDRIRPFQQAGEQIRRVLGLTEVRKLNTNQGQKEAQIALSPFQQSDAVLQALGPLWGTKREIEPFFLIFLAEEICEPIAEKRMIAASEADVTRFELAILRASLAVFLALHVGVFNLSVLTKIRERVFDETVSGGETAQNQQQIDLIVSLAHRLLPNPDVREIKITDIMGKDAVSTKIKTRLERVTKDLIQAGAPNSSLYGEGGICG